MDSTQDEWRQVTFYTKVPADVVTDKVCELDSIAHLSIFKQTDAPGRAGELRQQVDALLIQIMKWVLPELYFTVDDYKPLVQSREATLALIDSATRTAVTEALDKLFPEYDTVTNPGYSFVVSKREVDAVRAVIAAGGRQ